VGGGGREGEDGLWAAVTEEEEGVGVRGVQDCHVGGGGVGRGEAGLRHGEDCLDVGVGVVLGSHCEGRLAYGDYVQGKAGIWQDGGR
jgi:hypothetical protein